ncbi:hypothetical protein PQX77_015340 [Marasmius sp. AFHP31]|nr:hypothetical protein PQX77_015340 [Marasmius sp. AFHP31]
MRFFGLLVLAVYTSITTATVLPRTPPPKCTKPLLERREWRTLSTAQKDEYLNAVKCLMKKPSSGVTSKPQARTRYDDFVASHITLGDEVHMVGHFLPWHRLLLSLYEKALREECGYTGAQPYWNWSLDVDNGMTSWAASPIWDPVHGFGGNGVHIPNYNGPFNNNSNFNGWVVGANTGGGCIQDGPFKDYMLALGPGPVLNQDRCITRDWIPTYFPMVSAGAVAQVLNSPNFEAFRVDLEGVITPQVKVHDGGHLAVGGEMHDLYSSNGEPTFYLHHAHLDKIWWDWQQLASSNLYDVSGRSGPNPPFQDVTLDFMMRSDGLTSLVSIEDVMDIENEFLCFTYI